MNVKERWAAAVKQHTLTTGHRPKTLLASQADEWEWAALSVNDVGDTLLAKIIVQGVREAMPRFHGIHIQWDQQTTTVI